VGWMHETVPQPPWSALYDFRWLAPSGLAALLLLVLMLVVVALRMEVLAPDVPLRFDAAGVVTQIGSRWDLLRLPLFGFLLFVIDGAGGIWIHGRDRLVARMLWVGAAVL